MCYETIYLLTTKSVKIQFTSKAKSLKIRDLYAFDEISHFYFTNSIFCIQG